MPDYVDRCASSHQASPGPLQPLAATGQQSLVEQIAGPAAVQRSPRFRPRRVHGDAWRTGERAGSGLSHVNTMFVGTVR
jgi:hypothetical protein